ncbi:MAG: 30S ribosomal protein S4 [Candidatus Omnitrophica bacterium]|nr:30S ribosomal protein S4 [Candidatus Omnitrophota bacterium]MDE2008497.1 30S ribosomal protein S4 [Candidatus Omnitrophota bacterium]MDE2213963.1 30S ribosomal protein S4 [Candidatus Omnitrophota bacterium]MDE2231382.1 30S ribosomal protein S4 [Candidatus Omnitrophota bacterium]
MGRDLGPDCRLCRREGEKLFLKGTRCYTHKCAVARREYAPGQHGLKKGKLSNFGIQMREKQKIKRIYGVLETQFRNYFLKATATKGVTGHILLQFLERRLDSVLFNAGFAKSRTDGRQIVSHNHVSVNGRRVNIASYLVKPNDTVEIKTDTKTTAQLKANVEVTKERKVPAWLEADGGNLKIKVVRMPTREDVTFTVNEQLVVELYSR